MFRGLQIKYLLIFALMSPTPLFAADEKDDEQPKKVQYIDLKPPIVVNYGSFSKKSKFLQVKVSLRVENENDAIDVSYHQAPIRHNLIMLLSGLPDNGASSPKDIEKLRQEALKGTQDIMASLANGTKVTDLLFTSFVKQ